MSEQASAKIIGNVADFTAFPAPVKVGNEPFFIVEAPRADDETQQYNLISAICPHAGGMVRPHLNELICPLHYWCFDLATGQSTNIPGEELACSPLEIQDGQFLLKA